MRTDFTPIEQARREALDRVGLFHEPHDEQHVLVEGAFILNLRSSAWQSLSDTAAGMLVLGLHQYVRGGRS